MDPSSVSSVPIGFAFSNRGSRDSRNSRSGDQLLADVDLPGTQVHLREGALRFEERLGRHLEVKARSGRGRSGPLGQRKGRRTRGGPGASRGTRRLSSPRPDQPQVGTSCLGNSRPWDPGSSGRSNPARLGPDSARLGPNARQVPVRSRPAPGSTMWQPRQPRSARSRWPMRRHPGPGPGGRWLTASGRRGRPRSS